MRSSRFQKRLANVDIKSVIMCAKDKRTRTANIVIVDEVPRSLPRVWGGGRNLTEVVFCNLFQNAVHAMPNGGKISIQGKRIDVGRRTWVIVLVEDTGEGIAEKNLESIFHSGFSTTGGPGHGLWAARQYVESLGGESKPKVRLMRERKLQSCYLPIRVMLRHR